MTERGHDGLEALRPTAVSLAYRMLGNVSEAEDVVQEALLHVHDARVGLA
jgi:DNA-directed RNA polymerase specialized sigma24 family protein